MAASNPTLKLDPTYDHYDYPTTSPVVQPGHPGHTTPEQDAQVSQLRMMLEQAGCKARLDTLTLLRFLRARKFNVELTKQMFLASEKWRESFGVDELVKNFHYDEKPQIFEYYPQYYHKTDKDGRPVYIEQFGKIDLNAMYKITTGERMLQNLVVEYEKIADPRLPACSRKAGSLIETCCTIMDLKGVGITKVSAVLGYVKQASTISQDYYPERLGKLYLINAPWGFSSIFSIVKGFLDPVTVGKIFVLGSGYQTELLQQVPKENLPVMFGGICECEKGCQFSDMGPWQEPEWAKPTGDEQKVEQKADLTAKDKDKDVTIENKPSEIVEPGAGSSAEAGAAKPPADTAGAPAAVPAPEKVAP